MGDEYVIVLNDDGLPKLRISSYYRDGPRRRAATAPARPRSTSRTSCASAVWLIRSIHQRQRTIYKVTESIVKFQRDFLDKGIAHLKPLILRDVAEDIGMHESTVSRVTTNKYVHTPQGIFELKYFFNSAIARVAAARTSPARRSRSSISQIVAGEDPCKPLLRPEDRRDAAGPRHRHRPPHRGQVPRGAGHPAIEQAHGVIFRGGVQALSRREARSMETAITFRNLEPTEAIKAYAVEPRWNEQRSTWTRSARPTWCSPSEKHQHLVDITLHTGTFFLHGRERARTCTRPSTSPWTRSSGS